MSGRVYWKLINKNEGISGSYKDFFELEIDRIRNFAHDSKQLYYDKKNKILCALVGQIHNLSILRNEYSISATNDVEVLLYIYLLHKIGVYKKIEGLYLALFIDERANLAYIIQSEYGSPLPLYYKSDEKCFIFSTTLRYILQHSDVKRELDQTAVHQFLYYERLIPNELTLIKGINKLCTNTYIKIDFANCKVEALPIQKTSPKVSMKDAKSQLLSSIDHHIGELVDTLNTQELAITLTGGWDSNIYFHFLRNRTRKKIFAVTIDGGLQGKSEIPVVQSILKEYDNVEHLIGEVQPDITYSLPNIVWGYDGYIFEGGIFLRYELANILCKKNINVVFLGSCTDQVITQGYRPPLERIRKSFRNFIVEKNHKERVLRNNFFVESPPVRFNIPITFNLKMHNIMMNNFGVQCLFPVLNHNTCLFASKVYKKNFRKRLFIELIKQELDERITGQLKKSGAVSDINLIFDYNKNLLLAVLGTNFVQDLLGRKNVQIISNSPKEFAYLILQLNYTYLFNELFVSGKYDSRFNEHTINRNLRDFC